MDANKKYKHKKHFKVKVCYYHDDYYCIMYAHYNFFCIWQKLYFWFDCGYTKSLECWSTYLWPYDEAVKFAESLKSIEDVREYYRKQNEERSNFYKAKAEYRNNKVNSKIIRE